MITLDLTLSLERNTKMGCGRFNATDWDAYASSVSSKPTSKIFTSVSGAKDYLNPLNIKVRESRDSVDNPNSTPIIVGIDVTGSMGVIADRLAREGLGTLFTEILDRKPVSDPHLMFMAIGDFNCDKFPLQVSQFEADNRIIDQLTDIFLEGNGGGNNSESYEAPWYFAATHTSIDSFEKRNKKGYLFTVGDENAPPGLTPDQIKRYIGDDVQVGLTASQLFEMASRMYHVFHVIVEEGSHCRTYGADSVVASWRPVVGQHLIRLSDYTKLSEVIVSAIQVVEGADKGAVTSSWSGTTSVVVSKALSGMEVANASSKAAGVVRF